MDNMLFVTALLLLVLAGSARASDEFLITHWYGPSELTKEKFAEVAEANFTVVTVHDKTVEDNKKILDLAQACGMKVHILDPRVWQNKPGQADIHAKLDGAIADYSKHPALWGYCVGDEPDSSQFDLYADITQYLLEHDPEHIPFSNLLPTYANATQLGSPSYEKHVDDFLRIVKPRILSYDHYALMRGTPDRPDYFLNLEIIRRQAIRHKTPFSTTPMSLPHLGYRDPSEGELRWQVFTSLAYGARGVMYFTYTTPPWGYDFEPHNALIGVDGKPDRKYYEVKQINGELLKLAPTLMKLNSTAVYHTAPVPDGAKPMPKNGLVKSIAGDEFVLGEFKSEDGRRYAMLVNRDFRKSARARVAFSRNVQLREVSRQTGRLRSLPVVEDGGEWVWRAKFAAGDGKLIRIDFMDD